MSCVACHMSPVTCHISHVIFFLFTITVCEKGAGIIILDFNENLRACYKHLSFKQTQADGPEQNLYEIKNVFQIKKNKR